VNTPEEDVPEQHRRVLLSVGTPPEATLESRSGLLGRVGIVAGAIIGGGALLSTVATWTVVDSVGDTPDQTLWVNPPRVERVSPGGSAGERAERESENKVAEAGLRSRMSSPRPDESAAEDGDSSGHGSGGADDGDSSGHGSGGEDDGSSGHGSGHD
jgi:hypothetical protein